MTTNIDTTIVTRFIVLKQKYAAPANQISLLYHVPMDELANTKDILKKIYKYSPNTYDIRYRGPRTGLYNTLKKDAVAFSVYEIAR